MTDAEALLWRHLRNRAMDGAKFRRQQVLGPYVLDFYCHEARLVVEIDGSGHLQETQAERDGKRTAWLMSRELRVLRFSNREVLVETDAVLEKVRSAVEETRGMPSP